MRIFKLHPRIWRINPSDLSDEPRQSYIPQRGKGAFYWGVGLLVLYIGPDGTSHWGLNNVAALIVTIVGFFHT